MPVVRLDPLPQQEIREWLLIHQKRRQAGDDEATVTDLAELACISRQSVWNCMRGELICEVTQIRLSIAIRRIDAERQGGGAKTRLWSLQASPDGLTIRPGINLSPVLRRV